MVRRKKVGLLRFARNDVPLIPDTTSPSRRHAPEALMNLPPKEGVGNAGCPLHPRPRVHLVLVERTRVQRYAVKSVPDVATLILTTLTGAIGCRRIHRS